jgi:hypothetical protein
MMLYKLTEDEIRTTRDNYVGAGNRGGVTRRRVRIGITFGSAFFFASRHSSSNDFSKGRFRFKSFFDVSSSPNAVINSIFSLTGVVSIGDGDRDLDFVCITGNLSISRLK